MPVFQIEEKITLSSWEDITHRPCYESPVEPQPYRYVRIAGVYSFEDQGARCFGMLARPQPNEGKTACTIFQRARDMSKLPPLLGRFLCWAVFHWSAEVNLSATNGVLADYIPWNRAQLPSAPVSLRN